MDCWNVAVLCGVAYFHTVKTRVDTTGSDSDVMLYRSASYDERNNL